MGPCTNSGCRFCNRRVLECSDHVFSEPGKTVVAVYLYTFTHSTSRTQFCTACCSSELCLFTAQWPATHACAVASATRHHSSAMHRSTELRQVDLNRPLGRTGTAVLEDMMYTSFSPTSYSIVITICSLVCPCRERDFLQTASAVHPMESAWHEFLLR